MAWQGSAWRGTAWRGMARHSMARHISAMPAKPEAGLVNSIASSFPASLPAPQRKRHKSSLNS